MLDDLELDDLLDDPKLGTRSPMGEGTVWWDNVLGGDDGSLGCWRGTRVNMQGDGKGLGFPLSGNS